MLMGVSRLLMKTIVVGDLGVMRHSCFLNKAMQNDHVRAMNSLARASSHLT